MTKKDFELGQQIAELRGIVEKGFEGVHQRQDITNGRIGKAESRIAIIEEKEIANNARVSGIKASWQFILAVLSLAAAVILAITSLLK